MQIRKVATCRMPAEGRGCTTVASSTGCRMAPAARTDAGGCAARTDAGGCEGRGCTTVAFSTGCRVAPAARTDAGGCAARTDAGGCACSTIAPPSVAPGVVRKYSNLPGAGLEEDWPTGPSSLGTGSPALGGGNFERL